MGDKCIFVLYDNNIYLVSSALMIILFDFIAGSSASYYSSAEPLTFPSGTYTIVESVLSSALRMY